MCIVRATCGELLKGPNVDYGSVGYGRQLLLVDHVLQSFRLNVKE